MSKKRPLIDAKLHSSYNIMVNGTNKNELQSKKKNLEDTMTFLDKMEKFNRLNELEKLKII